MPAEDWKIGLHCSYSPNVNSRTPRGKWAITYIEYCSALDVSFNWANDSNKHLMKTIHGDMQFLRYPEIYISYLLCNLRRSSQAKPAREQSQHAVHASVMVMYGHQMEYMKITYVILLFHCGPTTKRYITWTDSWRPRSSRVKAARQLRENAICGALSTIGLNIFWLSGLGRTLLNLKHVVDGHSGCS